MSRPRIGRHPPPVACPVDLAGRGNERQRDHRAATRENRAIVALHAAFFAGTGIVAVLHAPAKGWIVAALVVAYNIGLPLVARAVGRHDSSPASPCTCCRPRQHWDGRPPPPTRWPARRPPSDASRRRSQYRRSTSARSCSHTFSSTSPAGRSRPSNQPEAGGGGRPGQLRPRNAKKRRVGCANTDRQLSNRHRCPSTTGRRGRGRTRSRSPGRPRRTRGPRTIRTSPGHTHAVLRRHAGTSAGLLGTRSGPCSSGRESSTNLAGAHARPTQGAHIKVNQEENPRS
jgi:hypothetical protein